MSGSPESRGPELEAWSAGVGRARESYEKMPTSVRGAFDPGPGGTVSRELYMAVLGSNAKLARELRAERQKVAALEGRIKLAKRQGKPPG